MTDDQTTEVDDQPQSTESPNAEAARYRTRLRDTEAQRDALTEQVTALRHAAVEDRLKSHKVPTTGFWASGVQLDDLLDEGGNLDDDKITTAADNAVETLGLERIGVRGRHVPKEGNVTSPRASKSWGAAFGPQ